MEDIIVFLAVVVLFCTVIVAGTYLVVTEHYLAAAFVFSILLFVQTEYPSNKQKPNAQQPMKVSGL